MMINKRLIASVPESKKYIAGNVAFSWGALISNMGIIFTIAHLLQKLYEKQADMHLWMYSLSAVVVCIGIRFVCTVFSSKMSFLSLKTVKKRLRQEIYEKLLHLGSSYKESISTSEIVQVAVEGVEQLETYFGAYLPQFFYSMLAPVTLFAVLSFINFPSALVLLLCVPLIPITIAGVQTFAKKLLAKYWGQYTTLGDTFLENLQGLTTLKIYQADEYKNKEMNRESENFRKITMKVLTMQLNSITVMDVIAYGGAALGVILSVTQFRSGQVTLAGCIAIILLSAEFFIPMRMLGSFFHIAMNGMAASEKIFRLLDLPEQKGGTEEFPKDYEIVCKNLRFSYEEDREILHGIHMELPKQGLTAIVGKSGCGKSTIASLLMGKNKGYTGSITIGGKELTSIKEEEILKNITYVSFDSYLFKGTVRENLLMGKKDASEEQLWSVLGQVNLEGFLRSEQGLDTVLAEKASNLSGGQRQRLALARAILHDTPVYIFDEATSNIDVESEDEILKQMYQLAKDKCVLMITHRLANGEHADRIYSMQDGNIVEQGTHQELLEKKGLYADLWNIQSELEHYGKEEK